MESYSCKGCSDPHGGMCRDVHEGGGLCVDEASLCLKQFVSAVGVVGCNRTRRTPGEHANSTQTDPGWPSFFLL